MYRDLVAHEPVGEWSKMAPFRTLSVDIECQGRKGCFPEAEKDAVIQIASTVQRVGEEAPFLRHVLTLNTCSAIAGAVVESFQREQDMLCRCARRAFVSRAHRCAACADMLDGRPHHPCHVAQRLKFAGAGGRR